MLSSIYLLGEWDSELRHVIYGNSHYWDAMTGLIPEKKVPINCQGIVGGFALLVVLLSGLLAQ